MDRRRKTKKKKALEKGQEQKKAHAGSKQKDEQASEITHLEEDDADEQVEGHPEDVDDGGPHLLGNEPRPQSHHGRPEDSHAGLEKAEGKQLELSLQRDAAAAALAQAGPCGGEGRHRRGKQSVEQLGEDTRRRSNTEHPAPGYSL